MSDAREAAAVAIGRRAPTRPAATPAVAGIAVALFLSLLAVLALRLADGRDPALRMRAASLPPRRVLIRRIYERRVIVHLPANAPAQASRSAQQVGATGGFAASAVTRT